MKSCHLSVPCNLRGKLGIKRHGQLRLELNFFHALHHETLYSNCQVLSLKAYIFMLRFCHRLNNFWILNLNRQAIYKCKVYFLRNLKNKKVHLCCDHFTHFRNFDLMHQEPEILWEREGKPQFQRHTHGLFCLKWKARNKQANCSRFLPPNKFQTGHWFSWEDTFSTECNSPDQVPTASSFFLQLSFPHTRHGPPLGDEQELFKQPFFSSGSMPF